MYYYKTKEKITSFLSRTDSMIVFTKISILVFVIILLFMAYKVNTYALIFIIFPVGFLLFLLNRKNILLNWLEIKETYGKPGKDKVDYKILQKNYQYLKNEDKTKCFIIDKSTAHDLNLIQVFKLINKTITEPGKCILYKQLQELLLEKDELFKRNQLVREFEQNQELREKLRFILKDDAEGEHKEITKILFAILDKVESNFKILFPLAFLALFSLVLVPIFKEYIVIFMIFPLFTLNYFRHYREIENYSFEPEQLLYLKKMVKTGYNIQKLIQNVDNQELNILSQKLAVSLKRTTPFQNSILLLNCRKEDIFSMIFNFLKTFLLLEVTTCHLALAKLLKCQKEMQTIYQIIGLLDSLYSISSFRTYLPYYSEPVFEDVPNCANYKDLAHPLLDEAVGNDLKINGENLLITGSNMSGKSTFLRTVGVNIVLAQTISTTYAKFYSSSFFRILTSISNHDSLKSGKSFYFAEAERLLTIIKRSEQEQNYLFLIDELLAGTNTKERIAASLEIISYLKRQNSISLITTHDQEITEYTRNLCTFYHFEDLISETDLKFDYKLKPGKATSTNALKILEFLEYPLEIIRNAKERILLKKY